MSARALIQLVALAGLVTCSARTRARASTSVSSDNSSYFSSSRRQGDNERAILLPPKTRTTPVTAPPKLGPN